MAPLAPGHYGEPSLQGYYSPARDPIENSTGTKKIRRQANRSHFIKFGEIRKNLTEMYLMSERNMNFLKT
jgi:hypothetical protein